MSLTADQARQKTAAVDELSGMSGEGHALAAEVLVEALARGRRIDALDASGVPEWLMAEPLGVALAWLEFHGRHCNQPRRCTHTPSPLRRLLKLRRAALDQHLPTIHAALWRYPESAMFKRVRSELSTAH